MFVEIVADQTVRRTDPSPTVKVSERTPFMRNAM